MNPETLALLALVASILIVGVAGLAFWVWHCGWHPGGPPRE